MNNIYWVIQDKDGGLYRFLSDTKEEAEHTMNYWLKGKDAKPVKVKLVEVNDNIEKELLKAISRQVTDNVPKLYIQDVVSGRVFEYGKNCHDKLIISEDGRSLNYYNFQSSDDSAVGDYRFFYEKPEDETDFDADEWARMVKHQSISQLLAEERKRVVQNLKNWCDKNFNYVGDGTGYDGQDYNEMIGSNKTINKLREFLDQTERGE